MKAYRIRKMGGDMYLNWWLIERRIWLHLWVVPIGWRWERADYFNDLQGAQNFVLLHSGKTKLETP